MNPSIHIYLDVGAAPKLCPLRGWGWRYSTVAKVSQIIPVNVWHPSRAFSSDWMSAVPVRVWHQVRGFSTIYAIPNPHSCWELKVDTTPCTGGRSPPLKAGITGASQQNQSFSSLLADPSLLRFPLPQQRVFFHTFYVILWNSPGSWRCDQDPTSRTLPDLTSGLGSFSKSASLFFKMVKLDMLWYKIWLSS